jgi:hypothetical protein
MRMGGHQRGLRRRRGQPTWNAALQLFLLATLKGFHLEWPRGEDQLLLVSVGTGYDVPRLSAEETVRALPADMAVRSLTSMMGWVRRCFQCRKRSTARLAISALIRSPGASC